MTRTRNDLALALMRLMAGLVFMFHGAQKLFGAFGGPGLEGFASYLEGLGVPYPGVNANLAGGTEFFGGLALILGLFHRWAAIPLVFTMLVACFTAHSGFSAQSGGMEYPLTLAVFTAGLGLLGPGRWSLDRLRGRDGTMSKGAPKASARQEVAA